MGEKELSESFDKEANDYDTNTSTFHHMISEYVIFNNLEDQLKNYKQPRILDAGCGTGKFAIKLLKKSNHIIPSLLNILLISCKRAIGFGV